MAARDRRTPPARRARPAREHRPTLRGGGVGTDGATARLRLQPAAWPVGGTSHTSGRVQAPVPLIHVLVLLRAGRPRQQCRSRDVDDRERPDGDALRPRRRVGCRCCTPGRLRQADGQQRIGTRSGRGRRVPRGLAWTSLVVSRSRRTLRWNGQAWWRCFSWFRCRTGVPRQLWGWGPSRCTPAGRGVRGWCSGRAGVGPLGGAVALRQGRRVATCRLGAAVMVRTVLQRTLDPPEAWCHEHAGGTRLWVAQRGAAGEAEVAAQVAGVLPAA